MHLILCDPKKLRYWILQVNATHDNHTIFSVLAMKLDITLVPVTIQNSIAAHPGITMATLSRSVKHHAKDFNIGRGCAI